MVVRGVEVSTEERPDTLTSSAHRSSHDPLLSTHHALCSGWQMKKGTRKTDLKGVEFHCVPPPKRHSGALIPGTCVCETLSGNRILADIIELK